jgi:hypothetical protein
MTKTRGSSDIEGFAAHCIRLIEIDSARRKSEDSAAKTLNRLESAVEAQEPKLVPLAPQWDHDKIANGTKDTAAREGLLQFGPTGPTGPTKFEQEDLGKTSDHLPAEWHAILDELKGSTPVKGFGDARWQSLIDDACSFLARWGEAAHLLGWTVLDLFGVHSVAPAARFDCVGLIPVLRGSSVVALTEASATIRGPSGSLLTYRKAAKAKSGVVVTKFLH